MEPKDFFLPIKIVAFDFDQTLVDEVASIRHRWKETLQEFSHIHKALEKTFFSIFDAKGPAYKAHLDDTLRELSLPESHIGPMVDFFRTTRSSKEFVYEHAREVVELLKERGFRIGIITDGLRNYQENRIKSAGLNELCDFIYYGDDYQKPDPVFFRSCIEREKILPGQFLYVGDHITKDIEGALAVGAKACYIGNEYNAVLSQEAICFKTMYQFHKWLKQK